MSQLSSASFIAGHDNGSGIGRPAGAGVSSLLVADGVATAPTGRTVEPLTPNPLNELAEKVRAATLAGRVNFMPWLDPYTEETPAMRRMYPIMIRHPVVKSALMTKVESVGQLEMQVLPADETDADKMAADFVRYAYQDAIDGEFQGIVREILYPGLIYKSSIVEPVWYDDLWTRGRFAGKRFFRVLKAKEYAQIQQDEFKNIVGVRAYGFGQMDDYAPSDFAIFKNFALFHGPGMSDLRAAYKPLWELDTVEKLHGIHMEKYLTPTIRATYGPTFDANSLAALQADISLVKGRSWLVTPESVKVEMLQMATRGEQEFLEYCKDRREQIALSIAGAYLQMLVSGHAGDIRGDSRTQKSTAELLVEALAGQVTSIVNKQLTPRLMRENYHSLDWPKVALGSKDLDGQQKAMMLVKTGLECGVPISKKATARQFAFQLATDDADTLKLATGGQPLGGDPGGGGGSPFGFDDAIDGTDPRAARRGFDDQERDEAGRFAPVNGGRGSERANKASADAVAASAVAKDRPSHRQAQYAHEDAASAHRNAYERHGTQAARIVQAKDPETAARHKEYLALSEAHLARAKAHDSQADEHAKHLGDSKAGFVDEGRRSFRRAPIRRGPPPVVTLRVATR